MQKAESMLTLRNSGTSWLEEITADKEVLKIKGNRQIDFSSIEALKQLRELVNLTMSS